MHSIIDYREKYGSGFILELSDGLVVPFSFLSISDYFKYTNDFSAGIIPNSIIENEIFLKCVKDEVLVENIFKQKAGTPTVVANTIIQYSAPRSVEEIDFFLNYSREQINNPIYQFINIICMGFSGYTPDDLLSKDINEIMLLLALAERKLLESGILKEPLSFDSGAESSPQKRRLNQQPKKPKVDISKLKDEFKKQGSPTKDWNANARRQTGDDRLNASFTDEETKRFKDSDKEGNTLISGQELVYNLDSDPTSETPEEKQMLKDARLFYKDYLVGAKKGEKIKIKDEDVRIAEAKKRMEENRKKMEAKLKRKQK